MTATRKRRFIAGAVCPACGAMDTIVVEQHASGPRRACVACDFEDTLEAHEGVEELRTRVNNPRPGEATLAHEVAVDRIKILDE